MSKTNPNAVTETATDREPRATRARSRIRRPLVALAVLTAALGVGACADVDDASSDAQQPVQCGAAELYLVTHDVCDAMDAVAQPDQFGSCPCMLGFGWNGSECVMLGDCQCVGADCNKLTETKEECEAAHASCGAPSSGGLSCGDPQLYSIEHDVCGAMDAEAAPDENGDCLCLLGFAFNGSECVELANCQCVGADCDKLTETMEECEAAHAECVAGSGQPLSCGNPQLYSIEHDACAAMDAEGAPDEHGHCLCLLGFAWNGSECVELGDCQCVGADCDKLTETQAECEAAHAGC